MSHLNSQGLFDQLALTKEDLADASTVFSNRAFKKILGEIIRIKKDAIIDSVETLEELERAKMTLDGNTELFEVFECAHNQYINRNKNNGKFNANEIIN